MTKPILVIGKNSQLGRTLQKTLQNLSDIFKIKPYINKHGEKLNKSDLNFIFVARKELDLLNIESINGFFQNDKFEAIMSLNGIYHLCNKEKTSWFEFTKFIFDELKLNNKINPINYKDLQSNINRPLNSSLNTSKIEEEIDIKIESWKIELKEYLKTEREKVLVLMEVYTLLFIKAVPSSGRKFINYRSWSEAKQLIKKLRGLTGEKNER